MSFKAGDKVIRADRPERHGIITKIRDGNSAEIDWEDGKRSETVLVALETAPAVRKPIPAPPEPDEPEPEPAKAPEPVKASWLSSKKK